MSDDTAASNDHAAPSNDHADPSDEDAAPSEQAGLAVALDTLPPGRRAVLSALKHRGEASAEEVAGALGVTVSAVRQHLAPLEEHGLVAHRDERPGPGRPRRRYCLTPAAEALWPKRYGQFANQLLTFIDDADPRLVEEAFEHRRRARTARARQRMAPNASFDDRVRELARILDDDGYLASCERATDGSWRVVEHNCAILDVAERYREACSSELAFLRDALPGADVQRSAHMMAGAHVCAYTITKGR